MEFYSLQQTLEKAISLSSSSSINDDDHIGGFAQTPASTETNNESEIEDSLAEMEQLVRRMDLEARSVGGNDAKQMKILRDCKAKAQELKANAREAKERRAQTDSRAQLFASSSGGGGGWMAKGQGYVNVSTGQTVSRTMMEMIQNEAWTPPPWLPLPRAPDDELPRPPNPPIKYQSEQRVGVGVGEGYGDAAL